MKKRHYIKAASLIETVMAISIITLCSLVGTLVYGSIIKTTPPIVRYSYEAAIEAALEEVITGRPRAFENERTEAFTLEKRNIDINTSNDIHRLEIIVRASYDTMVTPMYYYKKNL